MADHAGEGTRSRVRSTEARLLEVIVPLLTADATRVQESAAVRLTFTDAAVSVSTGSEATDALRDTVIGRVRRIEPSAFTRLSALGVVLFPGDQLVNGARVRER